ncbi:hypothetical protein [Mesorhizobium sp. A623]
MKKIKHIHIDGHLESRSFSEEQAADALRYLAEVTNGEMTFYFENGEFLTATVSESGRVLEADLNEIMAG